MDNHTETDRLVEELPTRARRDRSAVISELASALHMIETAWRRGRRLKIAERVLACADERELHELHEAVIAAMNVGRAEHPLAAIAFRLGCHLDSDRWPDAWLVVCELGGVSEAVALEVFGEVPDHFRRTRRRRASAAKQRILSAINAGDVRALLPEPSAGDVLEQLIKGELVIERA